LVRVVSASLLEPDGERATAPVVTVTRAPGRYLATVDGRFAGQLSYESTDRLVVLLDTVPAPDHEGAGVDGALVRRALDDARSAGTARVVPVCPFATWWVARHPEYADLLHPAPA
jgi:predicted GNAT family acetyltransferase